MSCLELPATTRYHPSAAANNHQLTSSSNFELLTTSSTCPSSTLSHSFHKTHRRPTMASHLYNLPPELLLATFQYMPRPSDLHALCLTSKPIRDWAIMLLYNKVTLDSDDGPWLHTAEKSLLRIGHPGLAHVRRLTIFTGKSDEDCDKEARFLRLFLSVLPRNGLRHL